MIDAIRYDQYCNRSHRYRASVLIVGLCASIGSVIVGCGDGAGNSVVPPPDVAAEVLAAARAAAPDADMTLGECTEWISGDGPTLDEASASDCRAMIAAAVKTCEKIDCFGFKVADLGE